MFSCKHGGGWRLPAEKQLSGWSSSGQNKLEQLQLPEKRGQELGACGNPSAPWSTPVVQVSISRAQISEQAGVNAASSGRQLAKWERHTVACCYLGVFIKCNLPAVTPGSAYNCASFELSPHLLPAAPNTPHAGPWQSLLFAFSQK